ncbi:MAG: histidine phosphatase family protein [Erysipelotrichaceae bacterium]|nr:histidine phosphatase family protein [Erysipelotrichaceae bacterium]
MTRYLYLIRHGRIAFDGGVKRCIGLTNTPLDDKGKKQAQLLHQYFKDKDIECIYTSPLDRCMQTAAILSNHQNIEVVEDLREIYMGEWENKPLSSIKKTLTSEPIYGEGRKRALSRFSKAVDQLIQQTTGNIIVVAHAGINCCYLAYLQGLDIDTSRALRQPYGCINIINIDTMQVEQMGIMSEDYPSIDTCLSLLHLHQVPENIIQHSIAVCKEALFIALRLKEAGLNLNLDLIKSSSLLHDIARTKPDHCEAGAKIADKEGYPLLSDIIRQHHDLEIIHDKPTESEVVYLADKYIQGTNKVTINDRFSQSLAKCHNDEAREAHQRRYNQAIEVENLILKYINKEG